MSAENSTVRLFPSLATVSTGNPSYDPPLHVTILEGHLEIGPTVYIVNLKRPGNTA
jgi:hypothetical protein